jgi:hypothetical protein
MKPIFTTATLVLLLAAMAQPCGATDTDSVPATPALRSEIAPDRMPKISVSVEPREAVIGDAVVWQVKAEIG